MKKPNTHMIWSLLDTITVIADELKFGCGEYRSRSVDEELSQEILAAMSSTNLMAVFRLSLMVFVSNWCFWRCLVRSNLMMKADL